MKIILLAGLNSIHTIRWANGLSDSGHEVHVISQHPVIDKLSSGVKIYQQPYHGAIGYFSMVPVVKGIINSIKPDIVNAHYCSGYGTTARLVDFKPWILSVWGSDVYAFPHKSILHKWLVKTNLQAASRVASTSRCMADEVRKLSPLLTDIAITPFGVDLAAYAAIKPEPVEQKVKLILGTVKAMNPIYGIDILIQAFSLLLKSLQSKQESGALDIELRLVGGGDQTNRLRELALRLGVADKVNFVGKVPHSQVSFELSKLDIYVALSRQESFGVAIIEAGAAGLPVVVSDVGGLPEVTVDGVTGFVVPRENHAAAAAAMERLVLDAELRSQMGKAARAHVAQHYSWGACVQTMLNVYENAIESHKEKYS